MAFDVAQCHQMLTWATAQLEYEGFPLMLRRPTNLDIKSLRPSRPSLVVVTHKFTRRKPNGLPEPDYNKTLFDMDIGLVSAFNVDQMGVPVLVETFGGKRHYYFYVTVDTDVTQTLSEIANRFPNEQLSWTVKPDPSWGFLERYAKQYF
jgi:hypothetical protein